MSKQKVVEKEEEEDSQPVVIEPLALPLKPMKVPEGYEGSEEDLLRFVDVKTLIASLGKDTKFRVLVDYYKFGLGYNDKPNVIFYLPEKRAISFSADRTTGKKFREIIERIVAEHPHLKDTLNTTSGRRQFYAHFKVFEGLEGNYLGLIKLDFTGVVNEDKQSSIEISGLGEPKEQEITVTGKL